MTDFNFTEINPYIRNNATSSIWNSVKGSAPQSFNKIIFDLSYYLHALNTNFQINSSGAINAEWIESVYRRTKELFELGIFTQENFKKIKMYLNRLALEEDLKCSIVRPKKIDSTVDEDEEGIYHFRNNLQRAEQKHEVDKINNRTKKSRYKKISLAISAIVGFGEGLVAAKFAAAAMLALFGIGFVPVIFIIGIPGMLVNICLFYGSAVTTMKDLFLGQIYNDENGNKVSPAMRKAINTTLVLSLFSGLCFGALSYQSATIALAALTGLGAASGGIIIAAAAVALVTTVALTCLYYCCTASLLKNNTLGKIKDFFKETFTNIYAYDCVKDGGADWKLWSERSNTDKALFYLKKTAAVIVNAIAVTAATAVAFVFTGASFGMFANQAGGLVISAFKASAHAAKVAGYIISAIGSILNTVFQVNSINTFCMMLGQTALAVTLLPVSVIGFGAKLATDWTNTTQQVKKAFKSTFKGLNWTNFLPKVCRFIYKWTLIACTLVNGAAQGLGGNNSTSIHAVSASTAGLVTGSLARDAGIAGMTSASNGANIEACNEVSAGPTTGIAVSDDKSNAKLDKINELETIYNSNRYTDKAKKDQIGDTFYKLLKKNEGHLSEHQKGLFCTANVFSNLSGDKADCMTRNPSFGSASSASTDMSRASSRNDLSAPLLGAVA